MKSFFILVQRYDSLGAITFKQTDLTAFEHAALFQQGDRRDAGVRSADNGHPVGNRYAVDLADKAVNVADTTVQRRLDYAYNTCMELTRPENAPEKLPEKTPVMKSRQPSSAGWSTSFQIATIAENAPSTTGAITLLKTASNAGASTLLMN